MELLYTKAVHIVFIVTWFAGLFYLPRLMVYAAEAHEMQDSVAKDILLKQYMLLQKRLLYGITWPSAVITFFLGARLLMIYPLESWLKIKLVFVFFLYLYHISLHIFHRQQSRGVFRLTGQQLRAWNEIPTVILVAVVFLAVVKSALALGWGLLGLLLLIIILMLAIRLYKKLRKPGKGAN